MSAPQASTFVPRIALASFALACCAAGTLQTRNWTQASSTTAEDRRVESDAPHDRRVVGVRVMTVEVPAQAALTSSQGMISIDIAGAPPDELVPFIAADRDSLLESIAAVGNGFTHAAPRMLIDMGRRASVVIERDGQAMTLEVQLQPAAEGLVEAWVRYTEGDRWVLPNTWIQFAEGQAFVIKVRGQTPAASERVLVITIDRPGHEPPAGC